MQALQQCAAQRGLTKSGTKAQLITRITEARMAAATVTQAASSAPTSPAWRGTLIVAPTSVIGSWEEQVWWRPFAHSEQLLLLLLLHSPPVPQFNCNALVHACSLFACLPFSTRLPCPAGMWFVMS